MSDVGGTVNPVPASFPPTPQTGLRSDPTAASTPDQTNANLAIMKWQLLIAVPLLVAGCASPSDAPAASTTTTTSWSYVPPAPTVDTAAQQARQQLDDLQASWLPYVADVTFSAGVLRVALQVDATTERDQALDIGQAIITNMRVQPIDGVQWVEITDGAGTHITQESV